MKSTLNPIYLFIREQQKRFIISIIRLYQKTFSPDHGILAGLSLYGCRYYPTCSEYTIRAVDQFGVARGLVLGTWRILRCNPWSHGGVDDVPESFTRRKNQSEQ